MVVEELTTGIKYVEECCYSFRETVYSRAIERTG